MRYSVEVKKGNSFIVFLQDIEINNTLHSEIHINWRPDHINQLEKNDILYHVAYPRDMLTNYQINNHGFTFTDSHGTTFIISR